MPATLNAVQAAIPQSGPGSAFDFIGGNSSLASTPAGEGFSTTLVPSNDFTIEALVHFNTSTGPFGHLIAGFAASQSNASVNWILQGRNVGQGFNLVLAVYGAGLGLGFVDSGMPIQTGVDYYAAAAYDSSGTATFWLQDLTGTGVLESAVVDHQFAGVPIAQNTDIFRIASLGSVSFGGLVDEVRLSNSPLTIEQLFIPEPSGSLLVATALLASVSLRGRHA